MHLEAGTRDHFMGFSRASSRAGERYGHLYAAKYAPGLRERVQEMVGMLKARYGLRVSAARVSRCSSPR